jgi:hypothetical protein
MRYGWQNLSTESFKSEIIEIFGGGYSTPSLAVTLTAFLLLTIGFWGLHKSQSPDKNMLSLHSLR